MKIRGFLEEVKCTELSWKSKPKGEESEGQRDVLSPQASTLM